MINTRTHGLHSVFLVVQIAAFSALFWLWLPASQLSLNSEELPFGKYFVYNTLLAAGVVIGRLTEASRSHFGRPSFRESTRNALWQFFFAYGCLFVYLVGSQEYVISRRFAFSFAPFLYVALVFTQRYLPELVVRLSLRGPYEQRVALVGSPDKSAQIEEWLRFRSGMGYELVGIICDNYHREPARGLKVLGEIGDLERAIQTWEISQVFLVGLLQSDAIIRHCIKVCEKSGVRLLVLCDFEERFGQSVRMFDEGGLRFLALRSEPLENPLNRLLKRALDVAIALPVTLLILPFSSLLVWALQRWQSPGPVLFLQRRSGLHNRPFVIVKYRTMSAKSDDEARQATRNDPRVFPAGAWLRRYSIDELPQFLNVLLGEMSVVGPRPHLSEHNEQFARALQNYNVRAVVKPGITGLAQVRGYRGGTSSEKDIADRVKSDIDYLENWSFSLDCWIILRTIWQMIVPPKSAY